MRKIKPSNENEMVYEFLKMEIASDRHKEKIETILKEMQIDRAIIIDGNIMSEQENALRTEILGRFRGYRKNRNVFNRIPSNIEWVWSESDRGDILKTIYIEYDYWNELSYYTGSPLEAAKYILAGKSVFGTMPTAEYIEIAQQLIDGRKFSPLILLTDESEKRYIILEGHVRMTAYGLVPVLFQDVSVLLGYCDSEELNKWYGEMPERPS